MSPPSDTPILDRLLAVAEEAAVLALEHWERGVSVTHKEVGLGQALTEADLAVSRLMHARFGPRLIEEETVDRLGYDQAERLLSEDQWTFVGDPIDGTKPYAAGLASWGTMVAACRSGWPRAGVMSLPAWFDDRSDPFAVRRAADQRGLLLAAVDGVAYWAPTRAGRRTRALQRLQRPDRLTHHVGWLPVAAQRYTLDYEQGFFPWSESSAVSDAALLALGRIDATCLNHMLWDAAAILPVLEALGFGLYRWPDLAPPPARLIEVFDRTFSGHDALWLVCRDLAAARALARAVCPSGPVRRGSPD
ncbi:inositol monophosphatase family protein [Methylobacterium sp. 17Sr1-1]|uniref:inositol monophosphatase family protein n=1 Tax=Methylobacterium sp. 17Sr1-1 TaxID=2202826 RepID=UPI000D6F57A1|nr:inositol monophosphatase family protein [Methylobacterium sp. 17Sr1-1]AWN52941.1 inositol monophosphatase [Methylobacterium sp. 17Sr1-1]